LFPSHDPGGASPHSGGRKNKIYDALVAKENKVRSKTAPLPKKKPKQTRDSLPIEETMKSIGRLNKIQNATKKPKKKAGGKVEYKMGGGKVIKKNMGGSLKSVNNPGLAKLPTPVRNKMGYAKGGGKVEYKMGGGKVKYRSIGGKVIDGNDITKMIYD